MNELFYYTCVLCGNKDQSAMDTPNCNGCKVEMVRDNIPTITLGNTPVRINMPNIGQENAGSFLIIYPNGNVDYTQLDQQEDGTYSGGTYELILEGSMVL
jgi:hypothetical protein